MAYIGRGTDKISNVEVLDNITFDGSSSYTLQKNSVNFTPSSANTLLLSIDGVVQAGNFTVSGSTIDFGTAVAGTSTCDFVLHYGVGLITIPADGSVTSEKLASGVGGVAGIASSADATAMTITSDEKIGIGTSSPQEDLSINVSLNDTEGLGLQYSNETKGGIKLNPSGGEVRMGAFNSTGTYFTTLYSNNTERMRIDSGGQLVVTANKPNDLVTHFKNTTGTNPYGLAFSFTAAAPDNNSTYFISGSDSVTDRFRIWSDGDVVNHDNSYGSISDERIKSNIVNANSQWNDIKGVKVRNYKKNDDIAQYGNNASTELGVIAQELEASNMNGLVKDEVLYTAEDKEVIDGDKNVGDIKHYKSVKYSILYMKSIKALQEAMERIETLEAKVTALENA